jgi:hypothetical protein
MSIDQPTDFIDPRTRPIRYIRSEETVNETAAPRVLTPAQRRNGKLSSGQKKLAAAAFFFGIVVTVAGWATNFLSVSDYAKNHGFVIPQALPIGLDLAIPTLLVIDYLATVKGANAAFLRWSAWALTGFTVYAGAVSANGGHKGIDWNSTILHGVMPAVSVVFVEAARWFRMWLDGLTDGTHTDRIPIARWICAPVRTARMRRRMVLWNEHSYPMAVVREAALLYARALLEGEGRSWRTTPVSLRHQIRTGQVPSDVVRAMRAAVENGDESWQPAVEEWVSNHVTTMVRTIAPNHSDTTPAPMVQPTSEPPAEPMVRTTDEPVDQTTPATVDRTTDETTAEPVVRTSKQTTPRGGSKRGGSKTRRTRDQLREEVEKAVAEHYENGGGEIQVKPLAEALHANRKTVRELLDEMNVRPIRRTTVEAPKDHAVTSEVKTG